MNVGVVIAHYNESLSWVDHLREINTSIKTFIVSKTDPNSFLYQPHNKGFEASAYLEFIVNMYDKLPEWCIFVHGHEYSWHHEGAMHALIASTISSIHRGLKYKNINKCPPNYYIYDSIDAGFHGDNQERKIALLDGLRTVRDCIHLGMFQPLGIEKCIPVTYAAKPAAQFLVHRDLIQKHSHETYKSLLRLLYSTPYDDKNKACVYEAMWNRIFTGLWDELEYTCEC